MSTAKWTYQYRSYIRDASLIETEIFDWREINIIGSGWNFALFEQTLPVSKIHLDGTII